MDDVDRELVDKLREYNDVLLLPENASYKQIRQQLMRLHKFGILNLSLNPLDYSIATLKEQLDKSQSKQRSLTAQVLCARARVTVCARPSPSTSP